GDARDDLHPIAGAELDPRGIDHPLRLDRHAVLAMRELGRELLTSGLEVLRELFRLRSGSSDDKAPDGVVDGLAAALIVDRECTPAGLDVAGEDIGDRGGRGVQLDGAEEGV